MVLPPVSTPEMAIQGEVLTRSGGKAALSGFPSSHVRGVLLISYENEKDAIQRALALAKKLKPAYGELYPFLEALFLIQASIKGTLKISPFPISPDLVKTKWENGFPLLYRWDFPLDMESAGRILSHIAPHIPDANLSMRKAHGVLSQMLSKKSRDQAEVWKIFLRHGEEEWDIDIDLEEDDLASFVFLGRSCIRPSIEWVSQDLSKRFPLHESWLKGYCPLCGSLPALLYSIGEGERWAHCSWCATQWKQHRFQCPSCDNRYHESLGYLYAEAEPSHRVQYCRLCKTYYKMVDTREMLDPPYFPLEEWTTLHLDLLAQKDGWQQPGSLSKAVYGNLDP